jgi:hypothetical protein
MGRIATVTVLKPFSGFKPGKKLTIAVDDEGTALDPLWRRRIKDAETDQCCMVEYSQPGAERAEPEDKQHAESRRASRRDKLLRGE